MSDEYEARISIVPADGTRLTPCDDEVRGYSCPNCETYWPVGTFDASRLVVTWIGGQPFGQCAECESSCLDCGATHPHFCPASAQEPEADQ